MITAHSMLANAVTSLFGVTSLCHLEVCFLYVIVSYERHALNLHFKLTLINITNTAAHSLQHHIPCD